MLTEAKVNFKGSNIENIWCDVCNLFPESQEHIWNCFQIRKEAKTIPDSCSYNHIDGTLKQQEVFTQMFSHLLDVRKQILERTNLPQTREDQSTEDLNLPDVFDFLSATENL